MNDAAPRPLRIGTRGSALARAQASLVRDAISADGVETALEIVETEGDRRAPDTPWGEGAFVTAIEDALLRGRIDVAVHSAKDVPTDEDARLTIAAFLPRAAPGDVLVARDGLTLSSLDDLPLGARVGTDSPRRTAFLRSLRPDLEVHPLHGNVDTRLRRLDDGETDVLILAEAGLDRLGRTDRVSLRLPTDLVPPAPGQGALAVQVRSDDDVARSIVGRLDDPPTRRAVLAERALLAASGGGCRAPLGALGRVVADRLELAAGYARPSGDLAVRVAGRTEDGGDDWLIESLLMDLAVSAAERACVGPGPRVIVTRAVTQVAATALALVDRGMVPLMVPAIEIVPAEDDLLDVTLGQLESFEWVVVTSVNAVRAVRSSAARIGVSLRRTDVRWAVVGRATERALAAAGVTPDLRPARSDSAALAAALPLEGDERILLPRSDLAGDDLPGRLRERGASVEEVVAYRTLEAPPPSLPALETALRERPSAVILTSPSTARGLLALAEQLDATAAVRRIPAVCIGPGTSAAATGLGFSVLAEAPMQSPGGVADAASDALHATRPPEGSP